MLQNYSNSLWLLVAKSIGSLKRFAVLPIPFLINTFAALKGCQFLFLFAIAPAGVVPCGGPKKSPRSSSVMQIIFSCWSFEISEGILRKPKIIICYDSFSTQRLICFPPFGLE